LAKFRNKNCNAVRKSREKRKLDDPVEYANRNRGAVETFRMKRNANFNDRNRIERFQRANLLGPIFICSCCKRRLFENSVIKLTSDVRQKIDDKNANLLRLCLQREIVIDLFINSNSSKTGSYICTTCLKTLISGKMPAMSEANGLKLTKLEEYIQLTEQEKNLIALNINFQYIFFLRKSRWAATKKQMISVPVPHQSVLSTIKQIPRLPKEAGLIPVTLKRKKEYKSHHKKEFIDAAKIFKVLDILKKSGHPYYQFYEDFSSYEIDARKMIVKDMNYFLTRIILRRI